MKKQELYSALVCAITHDLRVCDRCMKCGADAAEIRVRLVQELAEAFGKNAAKKKDVKKNGR